MSSTHFVDNHVLMLLRNGEEFFPRLIAEIDGATLSVYIETYIYAADESGRLVSLALQHAAARGVAVNLLLDGFGSADLPLDWIAEMRAAGVVILWFRPWLGWLPIRMYQLRRLHRKLVLVDERLAFVSSMNINDDIPPGGAITAPCLDYTVQVQGHVVEHIQVSMQRLWTLVSWVNFHRRERKRVKFQDSGKESHNKVIFLERDNFKHRHAIEQAYMAAIIGAKTEIMIANAYFLPGKRLRRALCEAAARGVRVQLLLQGQVEYRLQHYATLALYDELLGAGIEIHEYHVSFLHAKVAMVDGIWSTVGSSNIDPLSLWMAREANLVVHDKGFADSMRQSLLHEIKYGALPVQREKWREHGLLKRLMMRASYALVRLLIGFAGYARGHDNV